jgi:hypothetical protein
MTDWRFSRHSTPELPTHPSLAPTALRQCHLAPFFQIIYGQTRIRRWSFFGEHKLRGHLETLQAAGRGYAPPREGQRSLLHLHKLSSASRSPLNHTPTCTLPTDARKPAA